MSRLHLLFICVGNSCRSPMAEAVARALGGDRVEARSAGLAPLGWVADQTIQALESRGYTSAGLWSKGLDAVEIDDIDLVISLLGPRGLDYIPRSCGARREAWEVPDPFGEDDEMYLEVARQIEQRVQRLLETELGSELFHR